MIIGSLTGCCCTANIHNRFLGIYKIDASGGNQLDCGTSMIINDTKTYAETSRSYTGNLSLMTNIYYACTPRIFIDYALNWFDYKANYSNIFAEFVGNESRQQIITQNRGAAFLPKRLGCNNQLEIQPDSSFPWKQY